MRDDEIIKLWQTGLNKYQEAKSNKREYNQRIKIVRLDMRHRHERIMTKYEALSYVEDVILENVRRNKNERFKNIY